MKLEALTWLFIGLTTTAYITHRHSVAAVKAPSAVTLSAAMEVDPTRWRHDGLQPVEHASGNRDTFPDSEVLALRKVLAF